MPPRRKITSDKPPSKDLQSTRNSAGKRGRASPDDEDDEDQGNKRKNHGDKPHGGQCVFFLPGGKICGKWFDADSSLPSHRRNKRHLIADRSNIKNVAYQKYNYEYLVCHGEPCGRFWLTLDGMTQHQAYDHLNIRPAPPFVCGYWKHIDNKRTECGKGFKYESKCLDHWSQEHGERPKPSQGKEHGKKPTPSQTRRDALPLKGDIASSLSTTATATSATSSGSMFLDPARGSHYFPPHRDTILVRRTDQGLLQDRHTAACLRRALCRLFND